MSQFSKVEGVPTFARKVATIDLKRRPITTLQINVGKLCNQVCTHCHVDAGPNKKRENMDRRVAERFVELIKNEPTLKVVDLTGGAPELNPHFRYLVEECFARDVQVIDRCNLTVLFEPGQETTAKFLADHKVRVVASMPCYSRDNVDKQRGDGVFAKSIDGLKLLRDLGYGDEGTGLTLDLVYNPLGPFLPPAQGELEKQYKQQLQEDFGIRFNTLLCITNMPIKRFLFDLKRQNKYEEYMLLLAESFNQSAADNIMCRDLVSASWDGFLYDCDFNQMLDMPLGGRRTSIFDIESLSALQTRAISFDQHCYGCTAGAGSSCGGSTT